MTGFETVVLAVDAPLAVLTFNRTHAANSLNRQLFAEGVEALDAIRNDDDVRALIITGAGDRHFCGGADLRDLMGRVTGDEEVPLPHRLLMDEVASFPKPVIAAINGEALGGGCEVAIACDLRIMAEDARIGVPEIRFGALPCAGGTQRLPRLVGIARAKEMIYLGQSIDAYKALSYGLVNEVVPRAEVVARAREIGLELAALAPYALRAAKVLIDEGMNGDIHTGRRFEDEIFARMATPAEQRAAVDAAIAKDSTYRRIFTS
jgi:enoyl-CoA hydratase/carnithine racemase